MGDHRTVNMLGALALGLADEVRAAAARHGGEAGPAAAALAAIGQEPAPPSIERLRRILGLSHPGAVRLVDRLERDGLVERRPAAGDGRAVALGLTAAGAAACAGVLAERGRAVAAALAPLTARQRAALAPLLERMLPALARDEAGAERICRLCDGAACAPCPMAPLHAGPPGPPGRARPRRRAPPPPPPPDCPREGR